MSVNRSKPDQYQLRFPPGMRDRLKAAADRRGRSMNAEIIDRLERSFKGWPKISLPDDLFERVRKATHEQRTDLEAEITKFAADAVNRALPSTPILHRDLQDAFYTMLRLAPEEQREA